MRPLAADWLPYSLPLKQPWHTSRGVFQHRDGCLLRLKTADGRTGWGDCAPWPEFGITAQAASDFAEECAQLDLAAQRANLALNAWLSGRPAIQHVAVNAVLGAILNTPPAALKDAADAGFQVIKIKVGNAPLDDEIAALQQRCQDLPDGLKLRLDANGAWSMAEARHFIAACAELPIEGLEEPLRMPTLAMLGELQATSRFPIAIDESFHLIDRQFMAAPAVQRLIIKPPRHGGLLACIETVLQARAAGVECIFTSSLESACGLLAVAHLAAALAPDSIHGLATADWFASDTGVGPAIHRGKLDLPMVDGLGFQPATSWPGR